MTYANRIQAPEMVDSLYLIASNFDDCKRQCDEWIHDDCNAISYVTSNQRCFLYSEAQGIVSTELATRVSSYRPCTPPAATCGALTTLDADNKDQALWTNEMCQSLCTGFCDKKCNRKCDEHCACVDTSGTCNSMNPLHMSSIWSDRTCRDRCNGSKGVLGSCPKQCHFWCSEGCECVDAEPHMCGSISSDWSHKKCLRKCNKRTLSGGCGPTCGTYCSTTCACNAP